MLQCLRLAKQAAEAAGCPSNGNLHVAYVKMLVFVRDQLDALYAEAAAAPAGTEDSDDAATSTATLRQCVDELLPEIVASLDVSILNNEYLDAHRNELAANIAG